MPIEQIDPKALFDKMQQGDIVLIDVRDPFEHTERAIPGARLMPLQQCMPGDVSCGPGQALVFHCQRGGRSQRMCDKFCATFPDRLVYNLAGGIEGWAAAGLPIETGEAK